MDFDPKKTILIVPIGYSRNYKKVNYILHQNSHQDELHWFGFIQLAKFLFGQNATQLKMLFLCPDNDGAKSTLESGWKDTGVPSITSECKKLGIPNDHLDTIWVSDDPQLTDEQLWQVLKKFNAKLQNYVKEGRNQVIFDLTHSYRHLSFAGFIEALFLADVLQHVETVKVYYALAKQPLREGDDVHYMVLDSFIDLIKMIGKARDVIMKLRPEDLQEFLHDHEIQENRTMKRWLEEVQDSLFILQVGDVSDNTISKLDKLAQDEVNSTRQSDTFSKWSLIIDAMKKEIRSLCEELKKVSIDGDPNVTYYRRQLFLAEYMLESHGNMSAAYSYMREGLVSFFVALLAKVKYNGFQPTIPGGTKKERDVADEIMKVIATKARTSSTSAADAEDDNGQCDFLVKFSNFVVNDIGQKRNIHAHVLAGRKQAFPQKKIYSKKLEQALKDLKKTCEHVKTLESKKESELKSCLESLGN